MNNLNLWKKYQLPYRLYRVVYRWDYLHLMKFTRNSKTIANQLNVQIIMQNQYTYTSITQVVQMVFDFVQFDSLFIIIIITNKNICTQSLFMNFAKCLAFILGAAQLTWAFLRKKPKKKTFVVIKFYFQVTEMTFIQKCADFFKFLDRISLKLHHWLACVICSFVSEIIHQLCQKISWWMCMCVSFLEVNGSS